MNAGIDPFKKRRWTRGEVVRAKVIEVQKAGGILVDIEGLLFLVRNQSARSLQAGDLLSLEVLSISPLEFRIPSGSSFRRMV